MPGTNDDDHGKNAAKIRHAQAATSTGVRTLTSWLWVHQPRAAILGSREKHVNLGDSVVIICELRFAIVIS